MIGFWYFIPKSGIAYVFASVIVLVIWNRYRSYLPDPYLWIFAAEIILAVICFLAADWESGRKLK